MAQVTLLLKNPLLNLKEAVALLPLLSKTIGRTVLEEITEFLLRNLLLDLNQSALWSVCSPGTALLTLKKQLLRLLFSLCQTHQPHSLQSTTTSSSLFPLTFPPSRCSLHHCQGTFRVWIVPIWVFVQGGGSRSALPRGPPGICAGTTALCLLICSDVFSTSAMQMTAGGSSNNISDGQTWLPPRLLEPSEC